MRIGNTAATTPHPVCGCVWPAPEFTWESCYSNIRNTALLPPQSLILLRPSSHSWMQNERARCHEGHCRDAGQSSIVLTPWKALQWPTEHPWFEQLSWEWRRTVCFLTFSMEVCGPNPGRSISWVGSKPTEHTNQSG